ncbi:hypothetical protein XH93_21625 [Bradyrhizobium sp. CCBAU 51753]|nr:hypothetical protein XH93_21625 [Bradyrhizobium sp. CCBAU 51753]
MPRGPQRLRKSEIVRAVAATRAAGLDVERIDITPDGVKIVVRSGQAGRSSDPVEVDDWDLVK